MTKAGHADQFEGVKSRRKPDRLCSFCGTSERERFLLDAGTARICEPCAELCWELILAARGEISQPVETGDCLLPPNITPNPIDLSAICPRPFRMPGSGPAPAISASVVFGQSGFVYFLHAKRSNRIKIGWSINPQKRLGELLTGCPEPLECLGLLKGRPADERALHQHFSASRVHREWFDATPELIEYISGVMK